MYVCMSTAPEHNISLFTVVYGGLVKQIEVRITHFKMMAVSNYQSSKGTLERLYFFFSLLLGAYH